MREKQHSRDSDRKRALRTTSRRAGSLACRSRGVRGGIEPPAPQLVGRWQEPAVIRAMLGEISRAAGVLPNRCHGPPRCPRAPSALRPKTIDFQPLPMHLSGHYSNQSSAFTGILEAFPGGHSEQLGRSRPVAEAPRPLRLGNGVVQRAVIKTLVEAGRPMDVGEVHRAVEQLVGRPVSLDLVSSCLSTGARAAPPRFERVARGRYELAPSR